MTGTASPYTKLRLCINLRAGDIMPSCGARGSRDLIAPLEQELADRNTGLELETVHCMGKCHIGPALQLMPLGPLLFGITMENLPHLLDLLEQRDYEAAAVAFPEPEEAEETDLAKERL